MSVSFARAVAAGLREYGVTVLEEPGWEARGNGTTSDYLGALIHHTASQSSYQKPEPTRGMVISGRRDLPGPLCNMLGLYDGRLRLIAAHPANHAGASGGRFMGPLPVTRGFNKHVWGLEIDYDGVSPMSPEQHQSAVAFGAVVTRVLRRPNAEWIRAHAETSITGKYDPGWAPNKTIDMAAYRREVWAAVHAPSPTAPTNPAIPALRPPADEEDTVNLTIRPDSTGRFRCAVKAEVGGAGVGYTKAWVTLGSTWGATDFIVTALSANGRAIWQWAKSGAPGQPPEAFRVENNAHWSAELPTGTCTVTVEGTVVGEGVVPCAAVWHVR